MIDSKLLVFINDSDDDVRSIEQMFLDINEKTQKLDAENIFKGHCFEIFQEDGYAELKLTWIRLKKVAMKFSQLFGYKDTGQYLYLYLLKDGSIPENMAPKGKHYLEGKSEDDTDKLLKFPFMHFVANREKYDRTIIHAELRKIICNLYIYSNLFVMRSGKKSKENIDRTVIEEVQKDNVTISNIIDNVKLLRKAEVEEYTISDTDNFNIISFIYSIIDFYEQGNNFLNNLYLSENNYNLEHFVVPKRSGAIIDWVYDWKTNKRGKRVPLTKKIHLDVEKSKLYRKKITDYLIIDKDLNGSFECFDIVEKVETIREWHGARKMELPKHIQIYFEYVANLNSYKGLESLKTNNEQDVTKIEPVYVQFVEEYFEGIELRQNIMNVLKISFSGE